MFKQQIIEQISAQVGNLLKNNPLTDFETNFKAILHATLDKLDLVTREEFDIQQKVLANTRAKLEELEQIIKNLESKS
ncbi:MAG: ubiquinone biosynthesis accessory factor UbiK [Pseudomonadota bacterium]|jgi:BMFP domain-containing protein YqiC|nr:accessory factor UbiK family protein [Burkholderiales bacterium]MBP9769316.1 accessory factor UbiK family protein [Burkholderiales bacterium]MDQ5948354.1 ubiquinone biosynthesis accessory factor UbiK [Pseudomonadota bacterium]HCY38288.1 phosphoheptose isomerase [Neisseriales bacterium]